MRHNDCKKNLEKKLKQEKVRNGKSMRSLAMKLEEERKRSDEIK